MLSPFENKEGTHTDLVIHLNRREQMFLTFNNREEKHQAKNYLSLHLFGHIISTMLLS